MITSSPCQIFSPVKVTRDLESNQIFEISLEEYHLTAEFYDHITSIDQEWNEQVLEEHFARSGYLHVLEKSNPDSVDQLYVLFRDRSDQVVGTCLMQRLSLSLAQSFNYDRYHDDIPWYLRWVDKTKQFITGLFSFKMLTIGNLYLTGQYGYHFISDYSAAKQEAIVLSLLEKSKKAFCGSKYRYGGVLLKDYFVTEGIEKYKANELVRFEIDPNMILNIDTSWLSFEDYLLDMRSKYRIRLKSAMRKFGRIERRVLKYDDVVNYNDQMYRLYESILEGSGFVLAQAKDNYFIDLKASLKEELHVEAYFLDDQLVGFFTYVIDGKKMDSHFIGVDQSLNLRHQIYLNILLDLVRHAIRHRVDQLFYYRTALEIKSSIGAEPHQMYCYFRHSNSLINNLIIKPFFHSFVPQQKWQQRHPFKVKN